MQERKGENGKIMGVEKLISDVASTPGYTTGDQGESAHYMKINESIISEPEAMNQ